MTNYEIVRFLNFLLIVLITVKNLPFKQLYLFVLHKTIKYTSLFSFFLSFIKMSGSFFITVQN